MSNTRGETDNDNEIENGIGIIKVIADENEGRMVGTIIPINCIHKKSNEGFNKDDKFENDTSRSAQMRPLGFVSLDSNSFVPPPPPASPPPDIDKDKDKGKHKHKQKLLQPVPLKLPANNPPTVFLEPSNSNGPPKVILNQSSNSVSNLKHNQDHQEHALINQNGKKQVNISVHVQVMPHIEDSDDTLPGSPSSSSSDDGIFQLQMQQQPGSSRSIIKPYQPKELPPPVLPADENIHRRIGTAKNPQFLSGEESETSSDSSIDIVTSAGGTTNTGTATAKDTPTLNNDVKYINLSRQPKTNGSGSDTDVGSVEPETERHFDDNMSPDYPGSNEEDMNKRLPLSNMLSQAKRDEIINGESETAGGSLGSLNSCGVDDGGHVGHGSNQSMGQVAVIVEQDEDKDDVNNSDDEVINVDDYLHKMVERMKQTSAGEVEKTIHDDGVLHNQPKINVNVHGADDEVEKSVVENSNHEQNVNVKVNVNENINVKKEQMLNKSGIKIIVDHYDHNHKLEREQDNDDDDDDEDDDDMDILEDMDDEAVIDDEMQNYMITPGGL